MRGDNSLAIAQFNSQSPLRGRRVLTVQITAYVNAMIVFENVKRAGENVFDERLGNEAQRYVAIDAAEGQIVDLASKRRDILPLGRIDLNCEPRQFRCGVNSKEKGV